MKNDSVQQSLESKLKLDSISLPQLQGGITKCFVLTNRNFLRRRMGNKSTTHEIDTTIRDLVSQIFVEHNITDKYASMPLLRKACQVLEKQLGFETNSELSNHHQNIIGRLFELASSQFKKEK